MSKHTAPLFLLTRTALAFTLGAAVSTLGCGSEGNAERAVDAARPRAGAARDVTFEVATRERAVIAPADLHRERAAGTVAALEGAASGELISGRGYGGAGWDAAMTVTTDAAGNAVIAGWFEDKIDLGDACKLTTSDGYIYSSFVAKMTATGCAWAAAIDSDTAITWDVTVDTTGDGSVYVAGDFYDQLYFAAEDEKIVPAGENSYDGFLVKYSASGVRSWARRVGGAGDDTMYSVAMLAGQPVGTGFFQDTMVQNAGDQGAALASAGGTDAYVARFGAANGAVSWNTAIGGEASEEGLAIATNGFNKIVLAAAFRSETLSVGGATLTNAGGFDILLASLDATGKTTWAQSFGGPQRDAPLDVNIDPATGDIGMVGYFEGSIDIGDTLAGGASLSTFLSRHDNLGAPVWSTAVSGGGALGNSIALGTGGAMVVASSGAGTVTLSKFQWDDVAGTANQSWTNVVGAGGAALSPQVVAHGDQLFVSGSFAGSVSEAGVAAGFDAMLLCYKL